MLQVTCGQATSPKSERFEMRMEPGDLAEGDEWRRRQPDIPTRAEAVHRPIKLGLKAKGKVQ